MGSCVVTSTGVATRTYIATSTAFADDAETSTPSSSQSTDRSDRFGEIGLGSANGVLAVVLIGAGTSVPIRRATCRVGSLVS
jgi:hypothetical protein